MVEWIAMKELFNIKNGYTPSKSHPEYWEGGTIPWFRMEDIRQNGRILSDSIQHITRLGVKKGGLFPANSIIVATTATIGEHALVIVDSLANQQFTFLTKCKSYDSKLDMKYMYYYMFIVDEWCKNNINVSGFASVDMDRFKKLLIPIPSLAEQERIVGILDTFTAAIDNLKKQIELRKKQFEKYRDELLDRVSIKYQTFKLSDVAKIRNGKDYKKLGPGSIPVYGSGGIMTYVDTYASDKPSVLLPRKGSIENIFYVDVPFWTVDTIYWTEIDTKTIVPKFLFYAVMMHNLKALSYGGARPSLSQQILYNLYIPIPPLSEQQRIVTILETFESSIANLEKQLSLHQKQYEYYRNQLLTFE